MAANPSSILKEYLIALGFQIDDRGERKVTTTLETWDKKSGVLTKRLGLVAIAAGAMVTQFANSMERLYYASKRTDSAVGSIQALEYGASRIGLGTGVIRQSLEAMARNLRANPGLTGLLQSLGVPVEGRDKADVLTDLVAQLQKMPFYVAQQYANLFGIDPDTLLTLQQGLGELKRAGEERKRIAAEMGVDAEEAARNAALYNNEWRELVMRAEMFRDVVAGAILPKMLEMSAVTKLVLQDWSDLVRQSPAAGSLAERFMEGLGGRGGGTRGGVELSQESKKRLGIPDAETTQATTGIAGWARRKYEQFKRWGGAKDSQPRLADEASVDAAQDDEAFKRGGTGVPRAPDQPRGRDTPRPAPPQVTVNVPGATGGAQAQDGTDQTKAAQLFARLERDYALPAGILDRIWKRESNRGDPRFMESPKGAKGHMGFMDATAAQYDVKDPNDLEDSATGTAKYLKDLLRKYGGDVTKAAAAYNWGPGNLDKYGLGRAPKETRGYVDAVAQPGAGVNVTQTTTVTVNGSANPREAAALTREQIDQSNADVIRNMKARVN
jgi:hypothetical protein